MKALTLTQPWASLVAVGAKRIETRSWGTVYRGPLAIHAAKTVPREVRDRLAGGSTIRTIMHNHGLHLGLLPRGAVVATARLVEVVPTTHDGADRLREALARNELDIVLGDYSRDRFAWLLDDIQALPEPIPARGALGLWDWDGGHDERGNERHSATGAGGEVG